MYICICIQRNPVFSFSAAREIGGSTLPPPPRPRQQWRRAKAALQANARAATAFSAANRCERGDHLKDMCVWLDIYYYVYVYMYICIYIFVYMYRLTLVRRLPSLRLIDAKEVTGVYVYIWGGYICICICGGVIYVHVCVYL